MTTQWLYRVHLVVRKSDATEAAKDSFRDAFAGSGESPENERRMFDSVVKFGVNGTTPVVAFGLSTVAKASMKDGLKSLLDALPNARYIVAASVPHDGHIEGEVLRTNIGAISNGSIVTWQDVLDKLKAEFNLEPILE